MTALSQIQIPPPADWQAFERASQVLWRNLLGDYGLKPFGRLGQQQHGLDLTGYRNGDPIKLVGIQCKCISRPRKLTEEVVRKEVGLAAAYTPALSEYVITTTADDDASLDALCHQLTEDFSKAGRSLIVRAMGWQTLQAEIQKYPSALEAFDAHHSPALNEVRMLKDELLQQQQVIFEKTEVSNFRLAAGQAEIIGQLQAIHSRLIPTPADESRDHDELDRYRTILINGNIAAAQKMIQLKTESLEVSAAPLIRSRLKALEGHCFWQLGDSASAAKLFQEAYDLAPNERKGIAAGVQSKMALGEVEAALVLATYAIKSDPENDSVVAPLLMAAASVPHAEDPSDLIAASIKDTVSYCEGYLDFLRSRDSGKLWWKFAREKAPAHSQSFMLRLAMADSELDEFVQTTNYKFTGTVSDDWRVRLQKAVLVHRKAYEETKKSENPKSIVFPGLACNFALLLSILEYHEEAKSVLKYTHETFPDDEGILERAAMACLEAYDAQLEEICIRSLKTEGNQLLLRILILARKGDWQQLSYYSALESLADLTGSDGQLARLLVQTAIIRLQPKTDQKNSIRQLIADPSILREHFVAVSNVAKALGLDDLAFQAYEIARTSINPDTHIAARLNFAQLAEDAEDWRAIIKALDGYLDTANDTRELMMLARAFANAFPVTERALAFFEHLPPKVSETRNYLAMHAFMLLKCGNHKNALAKVVAARSLDPVSASLIILHYQALKHLSENEKIECFIQSLDIRAITGIAADQMKVAHILARHHRRTDALVLGYNVANSNRQSAEVELLYAGLFLNSPDSASENPEQPLVVGENCWVGTKDHAGLEDSFLIDASLPEGKDNVWLSNDRAKFLEGLKVGDSKSVGTPPLLRTITITEIKHRFLHLLHDIMQHFNDRHPNHSGFQKITMVGDDLEPLLSVIRHRAEDAHRTADEYEKYPMPISLMASLQGRSSVALLEFLERQKFGVRTCFGSGEERKSALACIERAQQHGAVLDILALWTIIRIDAMDVVKSVFGKILIPDSVLNELLQMREETAEKLITKSGFTAYANGRYYLTEYSERNVRTEIDELDSILSLVRSNTEIVPAVASSDIADRLHDLLTEKRTDQFMDAAFVAASHNSILISEDLILRHLSQEAQVKTSTWLQPVFAFALQLGKIDQNRYATLVSGLASRRHGYVSVDAKVIETLAADDASKIASISEYIGSESADLLSHVGVVAEFAGNTVESRNKQLKKALNLLLAKLVRSVPEMRPICLAAVIVKSKKQASMIRHVVQWCRNRKFAAKPILAELRKLERRYGKK